jgi:uncharacterized membrane protein
MNTVSPPVAPYRRVSAAHGASWWAQGWRSFLRAPWAWVGLTVALIACSVILHMLPMGSALTQWLSMPLFTLGAVFASVLRRRWARARAITPEGLAAEADNEGAFGESSRHWSSRLGTLLLASVLVLLSIATVLLLLGLSLSLMFQVGLMHLAAIGHMMEESSEAVVAGIGMGTGAMILAALLVLMALLACSVAFWFVGTLVALGGLGAWEAIQVSARAAFANLGALVVFTLLLIPLGIVATIPLGLGWLVLLPMISGASCASYEDVFGPNA